jgi:WD40 repeat protein
VKSEKVTYGLAFSPDGTHLAASSGAYSTIWDLGTQRSEPILRSLDVMLNLAYSPDGRLVATAHASGSVTLWDAASGQTQMSLPVSAPESLSASTANTLNLQSLARDISVGLAFTPDGGRVAAGGLDGVVRVWDTGTGEAVLVFSAHSKPIQSLAFSPDGQLLATASLDGTARLWDPATGTETLTLQGQNSLLSSVAFSPSGTHLAVAGDRAIHIYPMLAIDDLVALARSRVTRGLTAEECQHYLHRSACP